MLQVLRRLNALLLSSLELYGVDSIQIGERVVFSMMLLSQRKVRDGCVSTLILTVNWLKNRMLTQNFLDSYVFSVWS
jgi:hypothetical protein